MNVGKSLPRKGVIYVLSFAPRLFYGTIFFKEWISYLLRRVHDPDFLFFKNCTGVRPNDQFIDIGGNYGQSALSYAIQDRRREILSFEPNKTLEPYLRTVRRLLGKRYRYFLVGVGDKSSLRDLFVPKLNKVMLTGEASFDQEEVLSAMVRERIGLSYSLSKSECKIERFDDLVELYKLKPFIIKIDIQGYEPFALQGMTDTLEKFQPIFMLERNNDEQFEKMKSIFDRYRYEVWHYIPVSNTLTRTDPRISANYFAFPAGMVERDFPALVR